LIKTVAARANFSNANLADVLFDRAVVNEADLSQANLQRAVLTRSDLTGAKVDGADFTNALLDKLQQQVQWLQLGMWCLLDSSKQTRGCRRYIGANMARDVRWRNCGAQGKQGPAMQGLWHTRA
jgi:hypothetical protein